MRKLLSVLLIAMLGLSMFTACNPESSTSEDLVSVKLVEGQSRALKAEVDFSKENLYWEYTAEKKDNGLTTGQSETDEAGNYIPTALNNDGTTTALSQGDWSFTLYGYKDSTKTEKICEGTVDKVRITIGNHYVSITVVPLQSATGTLIISKDITILKKGETTSSYNGSEYTRKVDIYDLTNTTTPVKSVVLTNENINCENLESQTYRVVVSYICDYNTDTAYTAATATKYVNVYDYLTTTLSGSIEETVQAAKIVATVTAGYDSDGVSQAKASATLDSESFTKEDGSDNAVTSNSSEIIIVAAVSPAGSVNEKNYDNISEATNSTKIAFPAKSIVKTEGSKTDPKLNLGTQNLVSTSAGTEDSDVKAKSTLSESGMAVYLITDSEGAPVAQIDFSLEGAKLSESLSNETDETKKAAPSGHTYIAKGLGDSFDLTNESKSDDSPTLNIGYLGGGIVTTESDNQKPELLKYESETGYVEYRVYHFSSYAIYAKKYVVIDSSANFYTSLGEAVEGVEEGGTIYIWGNAELNKNITTEKNFTINLLCGEITLKDNALIELASGKVAIKNAKIDQALFIGGIKSGESEGDTVDGTYVPAAAKIGTNYYATLDAAFQAVEGTGTTVTLCSDVTVGGTINEGKQKTYGKDFTLDLNQHKLTLKKEFNYGENTTNKIENGTLSFSSFSTGGYLRFEYGCTATFEKINFISENEDWVKALQTYAKENKGVNSYTFEYCDFKNVHLDFEGGSYDPKYNKFVLNFKNCNFTSTLGFKQEAITTNAFTYGDYSLKSCNFEETGIVIGAKYSKGYAHKIEITGCTFKSEKMTDFGACIKTCGAGDTVHGTLNITDTNFTIANSNETSTDKTIAARCIGTETSLSSTDGKKLLITLSNSTFKTSNNAYPYVFKTNYYDNGWNSVGEIVSDNGCSYTKNEKTITPNKTSGNITWTESGT